MSTYMPGFQSFIASFGIDQIGHQQHKELIVVNDPQTNAEMPGDITFLQWLFHDHIWSLVSPRIVWQ